MKTTLVWRHILSAACLLSVVSAVRAEEKPKSDVPPGLLKKFDKNNDGVLDADEKAAFEKEKAVRLEKEKARRSEMLAKFDTNKDGKSHSTQFLSWAQQEGSKKLSSLKSASSALFLRVHPRPYAQNQVHNM